MREVENYVDHIRKLSDERDVLTLEFEAENDQLKADVEKLNTELEGRERMYALEGIWICIRRTLFA